MTAELLQMASLLLYLLEGMILKSIPLWASITFTGGKISPKFYEGMNIYQTFNAVKKTHPFHKMKYIINKGLENYLRQQYTKEQMIKAKQLSINFGGKNER